MKSLVIPAWLALVLLFASSLYASPSPFNGMMITGIAVHDDQGRLWPKPNQILPLITARQGTVFSSAAVRETLSLLYLKGLFEDVRVDAAPADGGLRLEYTLFPITAIDTIKIHGNSALSKDVIRDLMYGIEGNELRDKKLANLKADLLARYESEGYYDTTVNFRIEPIDEPYRAILHIDIHESAPTIVKTITFPDTWKLTDVTLRAVMQNTVGFPLRRDVLLDEDMEAIRARFSKAGYPAAKPGPVHISFRDHEAFVQIQGDEGPKVTVNFTGNHAFGTSRLKKQLLIWSEHDVSDAIIDSGIDTIKALYRRKGYVDAQVEATKREKPGSLDITFVIREGARTTVQDIVITGNRAFSTKAIRKMMTLRVHHWYRFAEKTDTDWNFFSGTGPFQEDVLDNDIDYIHDRYVDAGFLSVQVKQKVSFHEDRSTVVVTITIEEGPRTMTGSVSFDGNEALSSVDLLALVNLKPGAPFNERLMEEDRYRILMAYSNKAYLYARVEAEKTAHDGTVDISYHITEDLPVSIGRIILRGNEQTKDYVIMRELLVKPGDRYNYGAILSSQQRIYHLGYFRVARFTPVHPGEKEYVKDMLFTVEERPAGSFEVGFGYGDLDRLRGSVEVSHRNLWGTARYASLRYEQSDILKRAVFNFREPWLLNRKLESNFSLLWSDSKRLNSDTRELYYKSRKTAAALGIEKTFKHFKPSLTYQFENVVNYDVLRATQLTPEDSGRVLVSSLSPAVVWDLRDDPFNPRKGALFGIVLKEALRELWSEVDFSKLTGQASWFIPWGSNVIALAARVGTASPFRNTSEVPLHERFYAGGSTTVRGFTQDSIGPSSLDTAGNQIPTGGRSMAIFNIEFRTNPGEGLGFVLFADAGNVWQGQIAHLDDLRSSYGAGIRYGTPVGPLRIDYGQKIDPLPGESPGEIHFNIGNTF